jgi:deoxyribonucleoside regulator
MKLEIKKYQRAQIAIMHYQKGLSQQEIAYRYNLSKMTVSRVLQKAKENGLIKISVQLPFSLNNKYAEEIKKRYRLDMVWVVRNPFDDTERLYDLLGKVYAFYLNTSIIDNEVIGVGGGNTIGQVARNMVPFQANNVHIVQLMGGLANVTYFNPTTIIQEICNKLNATGTYITSFATVENRELRDSILNSTAIGKNVKELWSRCQKAIFGVGSIEKGTLLSPQLVSDGEREKLVSRGAIGDILGHCFNSNGEFIESDLEERLVSIPIDRLSNIEERVVIAGGVKKADAIRGALFTGLITTFITDEKVAEKLLA